MSTIARPIISLFALFAFLAGLGAMADQIPKPDEVLRRARVSKAEYLKVMGELQAFAPGIEDAKVGFPLLRIADDLQKIEAGYEIADLGGTPLKEFAKVLTRNLVRFIRLDTGEPADIEKFFRWSDDDTRWRAITRQGDSLHPPQDTPAKEKAFLLKWSAGIRLAIEVNHRLQSKDFVLAALDELHAHAIRRLLAQKNELTVPEAHQAISDARTRTTISDLLSYLQEEVKGTTELTRVQQILVWSLTLSRNIKELAKKTELPPSLLAGPGRLLIDGIMRLLAREVTGDAALVRDSLDAMEPTQLAELGAGIAQLYKEARVPESLLEYLWELTNGLMKKYGTLEMAVAIETLAKVHQKVAIQRVLAKGQFEGSYALKIGKGSGTLTIASTGSSTFILGLRAVTEDSRFDFGGDFSYFYVTYNTKDDCYEAHRFAVDSSDYTPPARRKWWIKLNFFPPAHGEKYNRVSGVFSTGNGFERFTGTQTETYPSFPAIPEGKPVANFTATYEGKLPEKAGGYKARLTLTQQGHNITGHLVTEGGVASVPLTFGYLNTSRHLVYVTSGESVVDETVSIAVGGRWTQVRGQVTNGGEVFKGVIITGGKGLEGEMTLARVEQP